MAYAGTNFSTIEELFIFIFSELASTSNAFNEVVNNGAETDIAGICADFKASLTAAGEDVD